MEAEPSIMIMPVLTPPVVVVTTTDAGARTLRAVKATAGSSPPRISSKEILSHFVAEVIAQGGEGVSLDPTTQNFRHRELEFGRICKVISGIVTVMYGFLGPSVVVSFFVTHSESSIAFTSLFLISFSLYAHGCVPGKGASRRSASGPAGARPNAFGGAPDHGGGTGFD
jgi:hypothetical protein